MEVTFADDEIRFARYDFPGATVHPAGTVVRAKIRDADWKATPPEIRTTLGETLFVRAASQAELEQFCRRNAIPWVRRADTSADLLEPFLDTWFDPEDELATDNRLREAGLSEDEITSIRDRIGPLMTAYDNLSWEWAILGLFDVLNATIAPFVDPGVRAALGDPAAFYHWTMEIAERHR